MTIRSRLLLLVLSVLLPGTAAALWLIGQTYSTERLAHERTLRDTSRALAMVVGRELEQRAAIARVLALSSSLDEAPDIAPPSLQQFEQQARRAMQGLQGWVELAGRNQVLLDTRAGQPLAAAGADDGQVLPEMPLVGALAAGQPGGPLHAAIVQPVQRDGRTQLAVRVAILPGELQQIIDAQRLPGDWVAAVLDSSGTVVARHPGGTAYAGRAATDDLRRQLATRGEGLFDSVTLDGAPVTGYFSTSPQGWSYLTAMPRAQFAGHLPAAVLQVSAAAALLLCLTVAGALWVARRIAGPVQSLKQAAADMQAGRAVHLRSTGIAECDEVAQALAGAAATMQRAQAELEHQVQQAVARTREAEQRAAQNQRVEALGRLTGGVAHDFNNLLGVISNSAHLIARHAAGQAALQAPVAATLRAVEAGSRLTQQLVRFAGRQPVRPQALELARFLPEVQELLGTVLGSRVRLEVAVAPATRQVTVDAGELELALLNLALNARDALTGRGQVWLQARNADADDTTGLPAGPYVLLSFSDDGKGIEEHLVQRVFEPFFTTRPVGQGQGLGLSQVHGFCVQAGGIARLASTPGLGTTVSLLLPAASPGAADEAVAALDGARPVSTAPGLRVLLVEDNQALGDATEALLVALHCQVQRAPGPAEALRLLEGGAGVDVVLSDVVMPGEMDGLALARLLRLRRPGLPVVLVTGYSTAQVAQGEFTVLAKPTSPQQLMAALEEATASARSAGM